MLPGAAAGASSLWTGVTMGVGSKVWAILTNGLELSDNEKRISHAKHKKRVFNTK